MKTHTLTLSIAAAGDEVFAWLADPANLSRWTANFIRRIVPVDTGWRGCSVFGETFFTIKTHREVRLIDLLVGTELDQMNVFPLRVIDLPHGAAVILTLFQPPGVPAEIYRSAFYAFQSDLRALLRRFGGGELEARYDDEGRFHPSLVTRRFFDSWDFYTAMLGFTTLAECDVYVHLQHPSGVQLGLLREEVDGVPAELVPATDGRGFWLNLDVADADAEYARLREMGVEIAEPPQDRPWGERSFEVRDPNGIVIFVGHKIVRPVTDEALALG